MLYYQLISEDVGQRDIVFLIDASDASEQFPMLRDFALRVVEKLEFGPNKCQAAVVQYSNQAAASFLLNTHAKKDDIVNNLRQLTQRGGSPANIGAALQYVKNQVFAEQFGSRRLEGVPQLLVILSDGSSSDDVTGPANSLKAMGVVPVSIGTAGADTLQLQKISYDPNYYLMMNDISDMPPVQEQLLSLVRNTAPQMRPTVAPSSFGKIFFFSYDRVMSGLFTDF